MFGETQIKWKKRQQQQKPLPIKKVFLSSCRTETVAFTTFPLTTGMRGKNTTTKTKNNPKATNFTWVI